MILRAVPSTIFSSASVKSACVTVVVPAPRGQQRGLVDEVGEVGADHAGRRRRRARRGRRRRRAAPTACAPRGSAGGPSRSGGCTVTRRSKRPGRSSAGSRTSGRLVAASTMTPRSGSKPSISVRIWLSVCSRSSLAAETPRRPLRARPIASSSSMKMIAGAASLACANRSRTREAPTPTIASTNSDAEIEKNGTPRLAGDRAREQRLAGAGRPAQQHAARDPRRRAGCTSRGAAGSRRSPSSSAFGLVDAGDVGERHALLGSARRGARASARSPRPPAAPAGLRAARAARTGRRAAASARSRAAGS